MHYLDGHKQEHNFELKNQYFDTVTRYLSFNALILDFLYMHFIMLSYCLTLISLLLRLERKKKKRFKQRRRLN